MPGVPSVNSSTRPVAVTPNDATDLSLSGIRALYIGGAGTVSVIGRDDVTNAGAGTAVTFTAVSGGYLLVAPKRVRATGTTATGIVGLV